MTPAELYLTACSVWGGIIAAVALISLIYARRVRRDDRRMARVELVLNPGRGQTEKL